MQINAILQKFKENKKAKIVFSQENLSSFISSQMAIFTGPYFGGFFQYKQGSK